MNGKIEVYHSTQLGKKELEELFSGSHPSLERILPFFISCSSKYTQTFYGSEALRLRVDPALIVARYSSDAATPRNGEDPIWFLERIYYDSGAFAKKTESYLYDEVVVMLIPGLGLIEIEEEKIYRQLNLSEKEWEARTSAALVTSLEEKMSLPRKKIAVTNPSIDYVLILGSYTPSREVIYLLGKRKVKPVIRDVSIISAYMSPEEMKRELYKLPFIPKISRVEQTTINGLDAIKLKLEENVIIWEEYYEKVGDNYPGYNGKLVQDLMKGV